MGTIIAIGGGEIGRPGTKRETVQIDERIISLTGKKSPRLLFIPTASGDSQGYIDVVRKYFGSYLGCRVDTLCLTQNPSARHISDKIDAADIIYVGGGNTKKMLQLWRRHGLGQQLRTAWRKGTVLCGVSAGAICWFSHAHSDWQRKKTGGYSRIKGLGFIPGLCCPHAVRERDRIPSFKRMLKKYGGDGYLIDDCAAIIVTESTIECISSRKGRAAYLFTART